jgi:hypothetical protein
MANLDRSNNRYEPASRYEPAARDRNRRQQGKQGKLPKPLTRLAVGGLIVLILVIVLSARSCARSGEVEAYTNYMSSVSEIVTASDAIGDRLMQLMVNPGDTSRSEVQSELDGFITSCEQLEGQATKLKAPKDLVSRSVHQMFLLVLNFRSTGTSQLKTSLMSALEVDDATVPIQQIINSLRFLTTSDFVYKEVFESRAAEILAEKQIGGVTAPSSSFLDDPNLASTAAVQTILTTLKTTGNLQAVHGVALKKVVVLPDNKEIMAGGVYDLTASASLTIQVTVENQGNMDEQQVPVTVTLSSATTALQSKTSMVSTMKAGEISDAQVPGLSPTIYGEQATLTVQVGPVAEERYTTNNSMTVTVIFKL